MYTGTEYVVNISDTHVASYGFIVDHTYLSHDAVETCTDSTDNILGTWEHEASHFNNWDA